jgi:hypothetical protein
LARQTSIACRAPATRHAARSYSRRVAFRTSGWVNRPKREFSASSGVAICEIMRPEEDPRQHTLRSRASTGAFACLHVPELRPRARLPLTLEPYTGRSTLKCWLHCYAATLQSYAASWRRQHCKVLPATRFTRIPPTASDDFLQSARS